MNRLPTLIKTYFQKLHPYEQCMAVGSTMAGTLGWGMAVNEASKDYNPCISAMFFVPTYVGTGAICGAIFPPAAPTYAAIKGLQWLRPHKKYDWE
jgi:hypothetical protein